MFILIFEWLATGLVIVSSLLTSYNVYPLNVAVCIVGNFAWIILGYIWRKWSLVVLQAIITVIYVAGLIYSQV